MMNKCKICNKRTINIFSRIPSTMRVVITCNNCGSEYVQNKKILAWGALLHVGVQVISFILFKNINLIPITIFVFLGASLTIPLRLEKSNGSDKFNDIV